MTLLDEPVGLAVVDKAEHGSVSGSDDEPNLDPLATTPEGGSLPQVQREEHSSDDKQVAPSDVVGAQFRAGTG